MHAVFLLFYSCVHTKNVNDADTNKRQENDVVPCFKVGLKYDFGKNQVVSMNIVYIVLLFKNNILTCWKGLFCGCRPSFELKWLLLKELELYKKKKTNI